MNRTAIAQYAYVISLMILILGLSISKSMMSIGTIGLVVAWVINGDYSMSLFRYWKRKDILIFSFSYSIFLLAALSSENWNETGRLLLLRLPIFAIPFFINGVKTFDYKTTKFLLNYIIFSCLLTTLIGLGVFIYQDNSFYENSRDLASFISNIRLSTLIVFCLLLMGWIRTQQPHLFYFKNIFYYIIAIWFIAFLVLMKSVNGIFILIFVTWLTFIVNVFKHPSISKKVLFFFISIILPVAAIYTILEEYIAFYNYEQVDFNHLETTTASGNLYLHANNGDVENGHYVRIYISDIELQEAWEKSSNKPYENYRELILRYMSSMGLRKDKEGFAHLSEKDIQNIENGIANQKYANPFNFRGRIYETIWELEKYKRTGDPNGKSFSTRLQLWKTCFRLIGANFLQGYGEDNIKTILKEEYEKSAPPMDNQHRMRPHNQFLYVFLMGGVFSFVIFVFCIFQPLLYPKRLYYLVLMLLWIMFIAMLNDDTLNTQAGIAQFATLFTLFSANIFTFEPKNNEL